MALQIPQYNAQPADILGAIRIGLDAKLAHERMMIADARAAQRAEQEERNAERAHQQQLRQFDLSEMKANYEISQSDPGGLDYLKAMADIKQSNASAAYSSASTARTADEMNHPSKYWRPPSGRGAAGRPLTQAQQEANEDARVNALPPPYPEPDYGYSGT